MTATLVNQILYRRGPFSLQRGAAIILHKNNRAETIGMRGEKATLQPPGPLAALCGHAPQAGLPIWLRHPIRAQEEGSVNSISYAAFSGRL